MLETILVGIMLFVSTNIDDVFLTMAFFADPRLDSRAVVLGKYAGIAALVVVSVAAAACALAVPQEWIALLGLAPLGLGIQRLWSAWRKRASAADDDGAGHFADATAASLPGQVASVAAITAANGGDNLGVYIPVFAENLPLVPLYVAIFAVMTGLWCLVGRALVTHPLVAATMRRLAGVLLPYVLIGLGLWILSGAVGLVWTTPPASAPEPPASGVSCLPSSPCHPGA